MKIGIKKICMYCFGLFIMTFGVSISKISNLGVSPVNSIPCVVSNIINIDMGICTTGVFALFILIQIVILRKKFKIVNLLQILCSVMFGWFVSISNAFCDSLFLVPSNYFVSMVLLMVSIVMVALGILFYLEAEVMSLPGEGVMQAISHATGIKISTAKIFFDWSMLIIATTLSLLFLGRLDGVREGTVVAAFGVGFVLKLLEKVLKNPVRNFIYGDHFCGFLQIQQEQRF